MTNRIEVPLKVRRAILVPGNVAVLGADFSGAYIKPGKNAPLKSLWEEKVCTKNNKKEG